RPYVLVGCFVVGMVLTPPDVFSQTLLAVPMWLLFEVGLLFGAMIRREKEKAEAAEEKSEDGDQPPSVQP
ncbi:MAG TPA: twin-arginine translocase subunit TatC, partial [Pseudomonas sp.]|nr:twin-arginine translocase subunit TatC [Pseudomonas sp.]